MPQYWRNGYGTEIVRVLLNRCKKTYVKKASAIIDPQNIASRKILEKYGFKSESIFRIDDESLTETLTLIVNLKFENVNFGRGIKKQYCIVIDIKD